MFKGLIRGGLLFLLLVGNVEAQSSVSFLPNGSLTGVTSTGTSTVFSTPILLPDGSAAAPSLANVTSTASGIFFTPAAGSVSISGAGNTIATFRNSVPNVRVNGSLGFGTDGFTADTILIRDAANTLALRNSTNAQTFNIYNTYTDASNYEVFQTLWSSNTVYLRTTNAGSGTARNIYIGSGGGYIQFCNSYDCSVDGTKQVWIIRNPVNSGSFVPSVSDRSDFGYTSGTIRELYLSRAIQGSKSKALVDNTATAFVRLAVADDDYEGCGIIYTAFAEDTATDARQTRTGKIYAAILNNSGTEAVAFSTGDSAVSVTAGTFTCTFDGNSAVADTIDLRATCDTSLAATTTLTFEYRLDCPSTVTVTPQ